MSDRLPARPVGSKPPRGPDGAPEHSAEIQTPAPVAYIGAQAQVEAAALERKTRQLEALLIQNARLYRRNQQQARRLSTLTEIAKALASTLQVEDVAQRVYEQVARMLDVGSFSLAVRNTEGEGLVRILVVDEGIRYPGGSVPLSYPVDPRGTRRPRILTAPEPALMGPATGRYGNGRPSATVIAAPMYVGDALVGELAIGSYQADAYTDEDAWLVQAIADQTAIALENARLYESEVARAAELEESSRLRQDFVSTVSHELRTPLTGIIGFTETLLGYWDKLPEERKLEVLHKVQAAAYRLNRLVQDLLFISRIDAQAVTLHPGRVPLIPLVEQAADEVRGKYGAQPIHVQVPADLCVYADAHRVEQVLVNLLDNAAKYSSEGAPITLTAEAAGGQVVVRVHDSGHGIDPALTHLLFTRFGKLNATVRAGHVGTGLGLYISKQLVETMGGQIWAESTGPGGSVFAFSLPHAARAVRDEE